MYYKDMSKYNNTSAEVYNIGWLDSNHLYEKGPTTLIFKDKLKAIFKRERMNLVRGRHYCQLCDEPKKIVYLEMQDGKSHMLGISEIWVPNKFFTKTFSAPDLILHYVDYHHYLPPQEFIDAVIDFDLDSDWFGKSVVW